MELEVYWNAIPIGKQNAIHYPELMQRWSMNERQVRKTLHDLSLYDNGDDLILVRSAGGKGFYRTDDIITLRAYRQECLSKGRSIFAPVKKINRVLNANETQLMFENNLRVVRESCSLKQRDVCRKIGDKNFDAVMLSKMENGVCAPTPWQLERLAEIYNCEPSELINTYLY